MKIGKIKIDVWAIGTMILVPVLAVFGFKWAFAEKFPNVPVLSPIAQGL